MDVEFWGVRGSFPSPGSDKTGYGGHTSCISFELSANHTLVFDAGTGIRDLGEKLVSKHSRSPFEVTLYLTHFHLDHILGFPFFSPLYFPQAEITVYSPAPPAECEKYLSGLMTDRYFPLEWNETQSKKIFKQVPKQPTAVGSVTVSSCPARHPQGCLAYRVEKSGRSLVYATDTEHPESGIDSKLADFARGASCLVYDATFTPEDYADGKKGWGHSTWLEGTKLARAAGVKKFCLFHYSPDYSDGVVDEMVSRACREFPDTFAARQGLVLFDFNF
jgi:ribonuclease BN (tRNA processing enzyme)